MSGKIDQALDEIISTNRTKSTRGRGRGGRKAGQPGRNTVIAPANGIKKNTNQPRNARSAPAGPAARGSGESIITVSNLPKDVNEAQIKDYFVKSVGPIKKAELSYGPTGASRGEAKIVFVRPDSASKALKELNGLLVDGRPMTIRLLVDASSASVIQPKGLADRIQPKSQPRSAATTKNSTAAKGAERGGRGGKRGGRGGKSVRPTKKTAEELDSEMADYFDGGNAAAPAANSATAPNGNGANDDAMDGEVL